MKIVETHARVLGGLRISVLAVIHDASPSCGIREEAEIRELYFLDGRPLPRAISDRFSRGDWDAIIDAVFDAG